MYTVTIKGAAHSFSAAHFIVNHVKCSRLHGHNFHVEIDATGPLNEDNFVIDFMEIKKKLKEVIKPLDHRLLLPGNAPDVSLQQEGNSITIEFSGKKYVFPQQDVIVLDLPAITSELLAKYVHERLQESFENMDIIVRIGETSTSEATYSG